VSCTPIGSPVAVKPHGTVRAGSPLELGGALSHEACRVLARAGHDARVNEIGHVAVAIG
jgi:hypothetical protein